MPTPCPPVDSLRHLLVAARDDTPDPGVTRHLERCPACRDCLQRLAGPCTWLPLPRSARPAMPPVDEDRDCHCLAALLAPPGPGGGIGRFGSYPVLEVAGRGGMGIVLRAHDPALRRPVALKVLRPLLAASQLARARFLREARAMAAVVHDNVVTIHAVGLHQGRPFLVMQWVAGGSLAAHIEAQGALPPRQVLRIAMHTARGLAAAHARGLVHRDIKPANLLLEDGHSHVRITDFGLAEAVALLPPTGTAAAVGTPGYLSPEQALGEPVGPRADLFGLGATLYAACTGSSPFAATSTRAALLRVSAWPHPPLRQARPDLPHDLCALVDELLRERPEHRPRSAAAVADRCARLLSALARGERRRPVQRRR